MDSNLFCISAADSCGSLFGSLGHVVSFINQTWQGGVIRSQQVNALGFSGLVRSLQCSTMPPRVVFCHPNDINRK